MHAKSKGVKRAQTCAEPLSTSFSKRRNRWRAAGIEIDFGRLPLLKRRGPGHTPRTDKSCRSDQDKDKSLEAARGHDVGPVGHEQEVPSGRGPRNSWRVYQQPSRKKRETEREKGIVDSVLLLAPTPRRRAASRRLCSRISSTSSDPCRGCRHAALYSGWTCQLFHCVIRVWQCFTTDGPVSPLDHPVDRYHLDTSGFSSKGTIADFPSRSHKTLSISLFERLTTF